MGTETEARIPRHVAIIMDGNGRWAARHGVERVEGHRKGALAVKQLVENLADTGIEYVTLYAFSTENWKRSKEEVDALMELLCEFIDANLNIMLEKGLRLLATGRIDYGGRAEIVDAAKKIASEVAAGTLRPDEIDETLFAKNLYLPEIPDPDLLIRTSGELRLSNFLLWELSYSEIYVTDTLWPDFDKAELEKAIAAYGTRNRRFGGRK